VAAPGAGRTRSPASGSAAAGFDPQRIQLELERAWAGLSKPLGLVHAGDDSGRVFVLEQGGLIKVVDRGQLLSRPFLDLTGQVSPMGTGYSERGLLGMAFHPRFRANGLFFVNYTDRRGDTRVVRYRVSAADRNLADPASARTVLSQAQPYANHNGGHLAFGPAGLQANPHGLLILASCTPRRLDPVQEMEGWPGPPMGSSSTAGAREEKRNMTRVGQSCLSSHAGTGLGGHWKRPRCLVRGQPPRAGGLPWIAGVEVVAPPGVRPAPGARTPPPCAVAEGGA
jgi:hypothetical protein